MDTTDIQNALANEARRNELKIQVSSYQGQLNALASFIQRMSSMSNDLQQQLASAQSTLTAFEAGAGPGITDDFGPKSSITQMVEAERQAAKSAVVDYVKANPNCTEDDAAAQWATAGIASHPSFPMVLQDGKTMSALYRANLMSLNLITENTWAAQAAWIVATDKATIMAF
jgi:hypothetical protein